MNLKYTPKDLDFRDEKEEGFVPFPFEGFVELRIPTFPEKLRFPKEIGIQNFKDLTNEEISLNDKMELIAMCAEKMKGYLESVELKYNGSGQEFNLNSVEDLYSHPEANDLMLAICLKFISGFAQKKTLSKSGNK